MNLKERGITVGDILIIFGRLNLDIHVNLYPYTNIQISFFNDDSVEFNKITSPRRKKKHRKVRILIYKVRDECIQLLVYHFGAPAVMYIDIQLALFHDSAVKFDRICTVRGKVSSCEMNDNCQPKPLFAYMPTGREMNVKHKFIQKN